jgi:hypothetical protein
MVLVAACGRGQDVADRIASSGSPLIERVEMLPANPFEGKPDEVYVYLVPEATTEQGAEFWCEVVVPAGARPSDPRVIVWRSGPQAQGESNILSKGEDCPS